MPYANKKTQQKFMAKQYSDRYRTDENSRRRRGIGRRIGISETEKKLSLA
jgi:hypothetical protein